MNDSPRKVSPLRQRMIEEMRMRQLAPKTRHAYIRAGEHIIATTRPHENPNTTPPKHHQARKLHYRITPETVPIPANIIHK
jgi:integrase/recombinase XerD